MDQSSTLANAAGTAISWLFASLCLIGSVVYFDEMRAVTRWAFAIPQPDMTTLSPPPIEAEPAAVSVASSGSVQLRADALGHFVASAEVNGRTIEVMVDTGASMVAFTWEDAERAGIYVRPSDFTQQVQTANGTGKIAPVMIDAISIGGITVRNVKAAVVERGKLNHTLLGMTFLGRLSRAEMRRGQLILEE